MAEQTGRQTAIAAAALGVGAAIIAWEAARRRRALDFRDRVVLITGGSRGLGFVLARQLAEKGARLALVARTADDLEAAAAKLREAGADVLTVAADVGVREQAFDAVRQVVERFGGVDVLINNAGIIQVGPVQHMQYEDFQQAMAVHFWGPLHTILAARPHLAARGGRIVNIASIGGRVAVPHLAPYSASKFALVGLSESLRAELVRENILVTTVSPGLMRTGSPLRAGMKGKHEAENTWFTISDSLPLVSISAERAAAKIIEACRYGDPELTFTPQARLAFALHGIAPGLVMRLMTLANWLLPSPTGPDGDRVREGRDSETLLTRSPLTALTRAAALQNNERVSE
ncbi:MAG TPA: SDR family oxidoreductase [Vicinamibacterales bacterium]|nr:SDR family oxidoreductase [Vicinamibacterales bacterium]